MAGDCDCFAAAEGGCAPEDVSPDPHENRPGLPALAYRRGRWSSIFRRLSARLPSPLQGSLERGDARELNTEASGDPAVALLDAFSVAADVLTFYQERIANEGFLRTATERASVGHLPNAIGYRLAPGVAAGVDLVFTVDDSDKAPGVATVPLGAQVMHIPGPGEIPQTFETTDGLEARAAWNRLTVPFKRAPVFVSNATSPEEPSAVETTCTLDLLGVATGLRQNSRLLILYGKLGPQGYSAWRLHRLKSVTPDAKLGLTRVTWDAGQSLGPAPQSPPVDPPEVYAFRTTTALFGWNAPDWHTLPEAIQKTYLRDGETDPADWPLFNALPSVAGLDAEGKFVTTQLPVIDLAQEHPEIEPDSVVIIADVSGTRTDPAHGGALAEVYRVEDTTRVYRQNFRISGHVTRITPSHARDLERFSLRDSVVYAAAQPLMAAPVDDPSYVGPDSIEVLGHVELPEGRRVIVAGIPEQGDERAIESACVAACVPAGDRTRLDFAPDDRLSQRFRRAETVVFANVAGATHGKTIPAEVLGSGDGSAAFPVFALKQRPVTHISDPTSPAGASSTLSVRVNGIAWERVDSLLDRPASAYVFTTSIDDDGVVRVLFGDGVTGSRVPSGAENVTASYRIGIGKVGEVAAESIALLAKKPLGVKSVTNLERSSGAEDPETIDTARTRAPASVLVLGRVVSLSDYADFARGFPGVGKASVSALWDGQREIVHLTVTDSSGQAFDGDSEVLKNLREALLLWGDAEAPLVVVTLDGETAGATPGPRRFGVTAGLLIDPAYVRDDVFAAARTLLEQRFGADARDLGQHVSAAEVIHALHEVRGVIAVDLGALYVRPVEGEVVERLHSCLPAFSARTDDRGLRAAELLIVERIVLREMQP